MTQMKDRLIVKLGRASPQRTRRMNRFRARVRSRAMSYARTRERYEEMLGDYLFLTEHSYPQGPVEEVAE